MSAAIRVARNSNGSVFVAAPCGCAIKVAGFEIALGRAVTSLLDHAAAVEGGDRSGCVPLPNGVLGGAS